MLSRAHSMFGSAAASSLLILMILISGGVARAQGGPPDCPELKIKLPKVLLVDGEQWELAVLGSEGQPLEKAEVMWHVSAGQITKGQGTPRATFTSTKRDEGRNVTVTAAVSGLPGGCTALLTGIMPIAGRPITEPFDRFGRLRPNDLRVRLDEAFAGLAANPPEYEGIFVVHFDRDHARKYRIARLRLILEHIELRKFDPSRISIYLGGDESDERVTVWIAPPGADLEDIVQYESQLIKAEELASKLDTLFRR